MVSISLIFSMTFNSSFVFQFWYELVSRSESLRDYSL